MAWRRGCNAKKPWKCSWLELNPTDVMTFLFFFFHAPKTEILCHKAKVKICTNLGEFLSKPSLVPCPSSSEFHLSLHSHLFKRNQSSVHPFYSNGLLPGWSMVGKLQSLSYKQLQVPYIQNVSVEHISTVAAIWLAGSSGEIAHWRSSPVNKSHSTPC